MKNKGWLRRFYRWLIAGGTALVLLAGIGVMASEIEENKDKLDNVQDKIDRIEEERRATEEKLAALKADQADAKAYINALDGEIADVMAEIAVMTEEKFSVMQQIETTEAELLAAGKTAEDQYAKMRLRIRYMYERGETEYLELLLSSKSLTELMGRAEYISQISEYDRDMLIFYEETVGQISSVKETLLERQAELAVWENELSAKEASLILLAEEKAAELKALEGLIEETDQLIVDYDAALAEEEAELLKIQKEIERLEEEERKRKEEEENKKNEANQGGSSQNVSAKGMIWPVASCTRITSYFGYRVDPLTGEADGALSNHKGIDVALPGGALEGAPVSAAAAGTVIISRTSSSAGNWIIIYHGNSTYTVYMHLQRLNVSEGQQVSRGQTIGLVGNTGWSTGAHLHFEVRVGGFVNSSYSVNPLSYVSP